MVGLLIDLLSLVSWLGAFRGRYVGATTSGNLPPAVCNGSFPLPSTLDLF